MNIQDVQLTDSEWDLMKVLWAGERLSVNQLAEQTPQWHPKTVRTMLIRLHKKGVVDFELVDGVQHYHPVNSREEFESSAAQSFVQRVFDGALTPMIAHFTRHQKLTEEEKKALVFLLTDKSGEK